MYEIKFNNWKHFKSDFPAAIENSGSGINVSNFLFRGQANSTWNLWSSFDRIEKNKSKYITLIENFKKICLLYNFNEDLIKSTDDKAIAAFAQHYGLPTRMLDWTQSPYFAAFFAFSSALVIKHKAAKCTIWGINMQSEALRQKSGIEFVSLPSTKFNYRMRNQIGHFTLSTHTEDSIEEFDSALIKSTKINDMLWKMNLPLPIDVKSILTDLDLMGINFSTVYPDIQGFVEEAIYRSDLHK